MIAPPGLRFLLFLARNIPDAVMLRSALNAEKRRGMMPRKEWQLA
jgi:hypothetical protein